MKEQIKAPEKNTIKQQRCLHSQHLAYMNSQPIRCRVQNTGNQDSHRNEYGHKIEEKVKAMQREIKENAQGTNCDGKETRTQNNLDHKEEINIQPKQNEETTIQKK